MLCTIRQRAISLLSAILLMACGGGSSAPSPTQPPGDGNGGGTGNPVVLSDLTYAQGAMQSGATIPLKLDIYQPTDICGANRPTVMFVHGGGFTQGNKVSIFVTEIAKAVNLKQFNLVSISYRLMGDDPALSAEFQPLADEIMTLAPTADPALVTAAVAAAEDTVTALRWMETNADNYCLDTTRLAYWGSSAGAYTVLQVAYGLNQYGIARPDPDVVIDYWGDLLRDSDLEFREAPFLILHGTADQTVDYQHALDLAAQGDAVNVPYTFYSVEGADHAWGSIDVFTLKINNLSLMENTVNFIEAHLIGGMPNYETVTVTP